jgi:hypothetical protein
MRFASFVFAVIIIPALADEPLYCSTSFQGYRVCSGPDGYVSHESTWNGITTRDDNRGNHWTTSRETPASPRSARSADVVDQIKAFAKTLIDRRPRGKGGFGRPSCAVRLRAVTAVLAPADQSPDANLSRSA